MASKQSRYDSYRQEERMPGRARSTSRRRRPSISAAQSPDRSQRWEDPYSTVHVEVNNSQRRRSRSRGSELYRGQLRTMNPEVFTSPISSSPSYTYPSSPVYDSTGVRVIEAEPELPSSSRPTPLRQDSYASVYTTESTSAANVPRSYPILIPNIQAGTSFIRYPSNSPRDLSQHSSSPRNSTGNDLPVREFESLGISGGRGILKNSNLTAPGMTFQMSNSSQSTNASEDREPRKPSRRSSVRETERPSFNRSPRTSEFNLPAETHTGRPTTHRRVSSGGAHLGPSPIGSYPSWKSSDEPMFFPADDFEANRRQGSFRDRGRRTSSARSSDQFLNNAHNKHGSRPIIHHDTFQPPISVLTSSKEVWIAVMGVTGSGKSTFIQTATGKDAGISHGLESMTKDISVHSLNYRGYKVNLIDTPGFDDTHRSETAVLQIIAAYLAKAYTNRIFLNGIIYLHPIHQTRVGGAALRSLDILQRLVGNENMKNVLLVTNMWDALGSTWQLGSDGKRYTPQEVAKDREKELTSSEEFWRLLIKRGACTARNTAATTESAVDIVSHFLTPDRDGIGLPMTLKLQEELIDKSLPLDETLVGQYINAMLHDEQRQLERDLDDLKKQQRRGDQSVAQEIAVTTKGLVDARKKAEILARRVDQLTDERGLSATQFVGRTSGAHAGLCNMM